MAYDHELAGRLRESLHDEPGVTEMSMFGGLAFLINRNMAVCAGSRGALMVRVDPQQSDDLIADGVARRMVMRGREMNGWLEVDADAVRTPADLSRWIAIGAGYARSLPSK